MKILIYTFSCFFFLNTFSIGCKSNKKTTEKPTPKVEEVKITLEERLEGLSKLSTAELGDYVVTIDGKTLPVYNKLGNQLEGMPLINFMKENEFVYEVFGDDNKEPKAIVLLKKGETNVVDENEEIPLPPGMETKLEYAPPFDLKDMNGQEWTLEKLKGKVAVINFWFINCAPCKEEIPDLNDLANKYKNSDEVVFLAITFDAKSDVEKFLKTNPFNYKIVTDAKKIMDDYIVLGFPTNIILDQNNDIAYQSIGYRHQIEKILEKEIKTLVNN